MKQDDVIRLAREAGIGEPINHEQWDADLPRLEAFAKLVAEHERKRYMQLFLDPENQPTQFGTATQEYREQEIKEERKACAKLADDIDPVWESIADAIRARGQA
jgi:hypothetical protein